MKKPVIALIIEGTYPWYRGGVSEWIHQYVQAFPDYHFKIIQVATDEYLEADITSALYTVPDHVLSFVRVAPPYGILDGNKKISDWFNTIYNSICDSFTGSDFIHVANTGFAGWLGVKMAQDKQLPLILTEHALYWKEVEMGAVALECGYKVPIKENAKQKMVHLFKSIAERVYEEADEIISVSECNINNQKQMGAQTVRYIPNGVKESWLRTTKERNETPTIGWIGRCAEMKNPHKFFELIDAFDSSAMVDAQFLMMICEAGEAELQDAVIDKARQYPQLKLVINKSAEDYLPQMDALCITSHNESQPLVLFEALSNKVLPIGWKAGDVTKEYGLILPKSKSPKNLAERFLNLWNTPGKWDKEVENRFQFVKENHTWPVIFNQYRQLFSSYLNKTVVYE